MVYTLKKMGCLSLLARWTSLQFHVKLSSDTTYKIMGSKYQQNWGGLTFLCFFYYRFPNITIALLIVCSSTYLCTILFVLPLVTTRTCNPRSFMYEILTIMYLQNWAIFEVNVDQHIPAPWSIWEVLSTNYSWSMLRPFRSLSELLLMSNPD